jgi:glucose-1-phosphate adenylyltransferase
MRNTLGILLAGGAGQRLYPLTRDNCKPAVPFGGAYRLIDVTLSNCINSGLRRIFVLTQYKQQSLSRHVSQGWDLLRRDMDEFVEVVPAQQRLGHDWYRGTADAVYQNLYVLGQERFEHALILSGDHIYKMDYSQMLAFHTEKGADVTVAVIEVAREAAAGQLGVAEVDRDGRVAGFAEKPADPKPLPGRPGFALASMGVYLFGRDALCDALDADASDPVSGHDFGHDVLPALVRDRRVYGFNFRDENKGSANYWRDVGTLDAIYEANMELVSVIPVFNLYDRDWPLRTNALQLPPAKFVTSCDGAQAGEAHDSIVAPGCIVSGAQVAHSVLSYGVRLHSFSRVEDSVLFPDVQVGRHARVRRAVIDSGVEIPEGASVGYDPAHDREHFTVTERGVVVVTKGDEFSRVARPAAVTAAAA